MTQAKVTANTIEQKEIVRQLVNTYGIDGDRVLFLKPHKPHEAWLPPDILTQIANIAGLFKSIDEEYANYIEPLGQVVHRATVIDTNDRIFARSGVASLTEERRDEQGGTIDAHALAAGRAIKAALTAAGFDPTRPGAVNALRPPTEAAPVTPHHVTLDAQSRNTNIKHLHTVAYRKGLIVVRHGEPRDMTAYRNFLLELFDTETSAVLTQEQFAIAINALDPMPDAPESARIAA
ncbi:MAG: hypothetical protein MSG64_17560 [Pyrinomonadaceae bacterium MAG19_C2-C3]|nr:hypothetical protein [Pyrinomonadaceae bacterium MAG19_C2-C3]